MNRGICYLGNAASIHTLRWANYFAEHDWTVDVITWHPPAEGFEIHQGVTIHRVLFPPHYIARYGTLLEIARIVRRSHPDIIHAHYLSHFGILGGLYSSIFRFRPLVLTAWGSDVLQDIRGWHRWPLRRLVRLVLQRADCVTCDADHMVVQLAKLGMPRKKIALVYFGTDTRKFSPQPRDQSLIERLDIAGSPTVISLRSLQPIYDIESLVRSIPLVLREAPQAKFIIAGDGGQRQYLESLARTLGVYSSARFVGRIANDDLPQYLNSADIYVSTSLSDAGIAASTAEAMACGLPVVITDFGDNRKWVEDGINGCVVPMRAPESLASRIIYLLQHEEARQPLGRAARETIEERNNREKEMGKVERIYEEMIERYQR